MCFRTCLDEVSARPAVKWNLSIDIRVAPMIAENAVPELHQEVSADPVFRSARRAGVPRRSRCPRGPRRGLRAEAAESAGLCQVTILAQGGMQASEPEPEPEPEPAPAPEDVLPAWLLPHDGVALSLVPGRGRCLLATRAFAAGEVVLAQEPCVEPCHCRAALLCVCRADSGRADRCCRYRAVLLDAQRARHVPAVQLLKPCRRQGPSAFA